ncbi:MAG: 30S ribosomal protein S3 [candidate division Zixibacteria bacterium]
MGQKAHPYGLRLGIIKTWKSRWFATNNYAELLQEDLLIRRYTNRRLEHAGIADVEILRNPKKVTIDIHTARPGIVIGRKGAEVDKLKEELQLLTGKEILLNIIEIKKPELSATLVAQSIGKQLEGRVNFRRAMKKALTATMKSGAEGIKIMCGGRLNGAEIARSEKYHDGRVPLHTLRADIDYATATAHTTYGCIGVKVWICKGEIHKGDLDRQTEDIDSGLGMEGQPGDARRRRSRRGRQPDSPHKKPKPSAKALDRSRGHRGAESKPPRPRPKAAASKPAAPKAAAPKPAAPKSEKPKKDSK